MHSEDPIPPTEAAHPLSRDLDLRPTMEILELMNREDVRVPEAVRAALPRLAVLVDGIAARMAEGGRLVYVGAGTSGRLGVLDAAECPPTFGISPDRVVALIAGGEPALTRAVEGAEDDVEAGRLDIRRIGVGSRDAVVGLAASGRTPYTCAALEEAGRLGALTGAVTCSPGSRLGRLAEVAVEVDTGPEILAGSTRLKAGTAQKLILNMISTAVMVRLGYVYDNLMVNVQPTNRKLWRRAVEIVRRLTGVDDLAARRALEEARDVRVAVMMLRCGCGRQEAVARLQRCGSLRRALEEAD